VAKLGDVGAHGFVGGVKNEGDEQPRKGKSKNKKISGTWFGKGGRRPIGPNAMRGRGGEVFAVAFQPKVERFAIGWGKKREEDRHPKGKLQNVQKKKTSRTERPSITPCEEEGGKG